MTGTGRPRGAPIALALAVAVATGVAGGYGFTHARSGTAANAAVGDSAEPAPSCTGAGCEPAVAGGASAGTGTGADSGPRAPDPAAVRLPQVGTGQFTVVAGTGERAGTRGRLVRYRVLNEGGIPVDPAIFAATVERILGDRRGWTAGGQWSFQRVDGGRYDLTVHLATAETSARMCAAYGLNTQGEVSCRGGPNVMLNAKRWLLGVPWYADALGDYRTMVTNHEIGHFLGHGHASCPGPGRQAPVMQTQTYSLGACRRNPYPYPDPEPRR